MNSASPKFKILFAASEAHPLVKTGGLADVCGSLPLALNELGHDTRVVLPAYRAAIRQIVEKESVAKLDLMGSSTPVEIFKARVGNPGIWVYLVDAPEYFDRDAGLYSDAEGQDWPDNAERFCLFARAVTVMALGLALPDWQPDVVHCNDWQTALIPALLSLQQDRPPTLFTIHNLAYQGRFPQSVFTKLELPPALWSPDALEFYGELSFIKGGLVFADLINTVSPTYMNEICTREFGCGLEGLLRQRSRDLHGILNGVDYTTWDPSIDPLIVKPYTRANVTLNKPDNKKELQKRFTLPLHAHVPLIGLVGRLVAQKGIDLVIEVLPNLLKKNVQIVILGSGERPFENALKTLQQAYPENFGLKIGYDETLAHAIEAGADMFLMPSRFEPCGLNQIYSLRYGTVPIVRKTGGLADTVVNVTDQRLLDQTATGLVFKPATATALFETLERAFALYENRQDWRKVMRSAMQQDFGWRRSAEQYSKLYAKLVQARKPAPKHPDVGDQ